MTEMKDEILHMYSRYYLGSDNIDASQTGTLYMYMHATAACQSSPHMYCSNVVYRSEITVTRLTFHNQTADVTYCANITLFLHWRSH